MKNLVVFTVLCFSLELMLPWSAMTADVVRVGAIFAQTGEAVTSNSSSLQGLGFAMEEINAQGGILGKTLEVVMFDNQSTPIGSKVAADEAIKAGVIAIIGAQWSSHSLVIAKIAQRHHIPMITNYSTHPDVTRVGNYIFRVCFTDPFQGKAMAQFVRQDLNAETSVIFKKVTSDYSMGFAQAFRHNFEAMHGQVLLELNYLQNERNFETLLQQVKQRPPDILFIPGHDESASIATQAQDMGILSLFAGGDGWGETEFYQLGGRDIKHGYYSTHWSEKIDREANREFLQKYSKYGTITTGTVLAYDAVFLLADAIRRAGSFDPEHIRDALAHTQNFEGVTGNLSFNEYGDPLKDVVVMELVNGHAHYMKTIHP